jgi:hypothetical protein
MVPQGRTTAPPGESRFVRQGLRRATPTGALASRTDPGRDPALNRNGAVLPEGQNHTKTSMVRLLLSMLTHGGTWS